MANNRRNKHPHGSNPRQPANEHHGSTAEETAAVNETFKAFAGQYQEDSKQSGLREKKRFRIELGLAVGVVLNLVLTGGLLIAGAFQADYGGQQVKASQDQLGVMQDQEHRQLRAYVGVTPKGIEDFGKPDQVLHIMRKNYGATPANDLFMDRPNIQVVPVKNVAFTPALCWPAPPSPINTLTLFPSQELRFDIQAQTLSEQQIKLVRDGSDYQLIYWGTLHYKDVFGERHCTRYCWTFKGEKMSENDSNYCLQHNDAY